MLGDTVRETRIKKNLTQAKLARLAGVSRRHLAALEKGANVSVHILQKVASVLDLTEIQLGTITLRTTADTPSINVHLLADAIRDARSGTYGVDSMLARAEGILSGDTSMVPAHPPAREGSLVARFPRLPARPTALPAAGADLHDHAGEWLEVRTAGELRQGQPVDETKAESVIVPASLVEKGEILFRARGTDLHDLGIEDGDLLVVQLRAKGRAATGELAIGRIGKDVYVGRWWQKHGRKSIVSDGLAEVATGTSRRHVKVVAVINQIIRPLPAVSGP